MNSLNRHIPPVLFWSLLFFLLPVTHSCAAAVPDAPSIEECACCPSSEATCASSPQAKGEEKVLWDIWSLMRMAGDDAGWGHSVTSSYVEGGKTFYKTEITNFMEIKRFGQSLTITMEMSWLEDENGKVIEQHQKNLMSEQETLYDLKVSGTEAVFAITTLGKPIEKTIPWDKDTVGPVGTLKIRKERGLKPGEKFSFKVFSFDLAKIATVTLEQKEFEETELLDGEKRTLHRSVSYMDILPGIKTSEWCDEEFTSIKTVTNVTGIKIETYITTKERAQNSGGGELKADLILETMAKSNINLPAPYSLDSILYRFEAKDPDLGIPEGLGDIRQKVIENDGQKAVVLIKTCFPEKSQKRPMKDVPDELLEYIEPNAFLQCDHAGLKAKAIELVGDEPDAWKAACRLEKFVYDYIEDKNFGTGFASAAEVFENPTGDCSEHGVLLAALCRAAGIPARVGVGYMYLGGIFGGHMWAEVWINGEWYPIDGVMGIGRVDPTHIRFSSGSLKGGGLGEAFLNAVTALGNLKITILEFTRGQRTVTVGESFVDYAIDGDTYTNILYGISITKPKGYEFENYKKDFSGVKFTLVEMEGESDADLDALPAAFSFTIDDMKKRISAGGGKIKSEVRRRINGRTGTVFMIDEHGKTRRVLALIESDTCYLLSMRIEKGEEERDIMAFETMAGSIRFSE